MILEEENVELNVVCVSTFLVTGQSIFGTAYLVLSDTVNTFKYKLDKFWQHQPIIYDFKAEILGTGSRSWH